MFFGDKQHDGNGTRYGDAGGASRFFYCPKASKTERGQLNNHPTVKALRLMRWLTRLVCPDGGVVLDPFAGSCSGGLAAVQEGFVWRGCELSPVHAEIGKARLNG